jgi:S-(hydroxymethyl)glutathione dehydrogenase/alcohol dehydrogenase
VLGHEGAGVVEAIGPGVTGLKPGDAVILSTLAHCGRCIACESSRPTQCRNAPSPKDSVPFFVGGKPAFQFANTSTFTELTLVREQSAIPFDPRVPFDRACLIVFGVGGIGLNCVQGGVLAGASRIVAVDVNPQKLSLARNFGATDVIDGGKENALEKVRDLTHGGADYAFECVGNLALIRTALDALAPGGTLVVVGVPKLGSTFEFPVHTIYNNKAILGCRYGAARPRKDFAMLADLYLAGRLKIDELITEHYPLDDFQRALDDLHRGALARGVFQF